MASTSISAITVLISGVDADSGTVGTASGDTCTITGPTGGQLDLSTLMIRVKNEATGGGALVVIKAGGSTYSGIGTGDYEVTVPTAGNVYIGGKGLNSARFLDASDQSLILTFKTTTGSATTCACVVEAMQGPFEITG
jgi:hypothetical protein